MKKQEQALTLKIAKWLLPKMSQSGECEIKHTRGSAIADLNELKEHQKDFLEAGTTSRGYIVKDSDASNSTYPDLRWFKNADSFVCIIYPEEIIVIRIQKIMAWLANINNTSLSWSQAQKFASFNIDIKDL